MIKPHHRIAMTLGVSYLVAVLLIVLWPSPVDRPATGTLHAILSWLHQRGMPQFINYNFVEFTANIAMFIPMGILTSTLLRNGWLGVIAGTLASCLIEFAQAVFLPARFASGMDVLANSLGTGLGVAMYYLVRSRRQTRTLEQEDESNLVS